MAIYYDTPGVTYDSGFFYDAVSVPPYSKRKMSKIKLNLYKLNIEQTIALGNTIVTAMTGNANFTTPHPTLAALGTLITTASTKNAAQLSAAAAAKTALADRDAALDALRSAITQEASYVDNIAAGDPVVIESAGMAVKADLAPIGPLDMVENLSITAGDAEGRLDLQWDPVHGSKGYQIQQSADPNVPAGWTLIDTSSASRISLMGLTSGQKLWFRVRAKAPKQANDGAWSDPATKIVP